MRIIKSLLSIVFIASIAAVPTGCTITSNPTSQPANAAVSPAKQLTIELTLATFALNGVASARDSGLITQAELNASKPYIDAFRASKNAAEADINAGNTSQFTDDLNQLNAAYLQLIPLLQKSAAPAK